MSRAPFTLGLLCLACHSVVGLEVPPVGSGKTILVVRARADAVIGVDVVAAGSPLPSFGRVGDLDVAVLELSCPPSVLGLKEGPLELLESPLDAPRLPLPRSLFVTAIRGLDSSPWASPDPRPTWVEDALRRIDAPADLACRTRGFSFDAGQYPAPFTTGAVPLPEGGALLLSTQGIARVDASGAISQTGLSIETTTVGLTLSGVLGADGQLYVLGSDGSMWRSAVAPGTMTRIGQAPVGALFELTGTPPVLYASSGTFGFSFQRGEEALRILRYDVDADVWTTLYSVDDPPGVGTTGMLARERSLLVAGVTAFLDRGGRARGFGALVELEARTGTVATTYIEVTPDDAGDKHEASTSIAQTRALGLVVTTIECEANANGTGCSDRATDRATRSRLVREVGGAWRFVDAPDLGILTTYVADAGPDAVWIGGFDDQRFQGPMTALLTDGTTCRLWERQQASTRLYPLGPGAWVAVNPRPYEPHETVVRVFQAIPAPSGCE